MTTRFAPQQRRKPRFGFDTRYDHIWAEAVLIVAVVFGAIAVLQSSWLPLLGLTALLGAYGGIFFVRAPGSSAAGRRQYVTGALAVAGVVLVLVGVRYHIEAGLTVVTVLIGSSPHVIRWITGP